MSDFRLALAALTFAGLVAACASPPSSSPDNAEVFGIYLNDGLRVGSSRSAVTPWHGGTRTVETSEMFFREADNRAVRMSDRTTRIVDSGGNTTRIERVSARNGRETVNVAIDISDGVAAAVRKTPYHQSTARVELPVTVRFDDGEALLRGWDFAQGNDLAFDSFSTGGLAVVHVIMHLMSVDATTGDRRLERRAYRGGALQSASELTINAAGALVETSLDMFGARMVTRPISHAEAATPASSASFVASVMVKSPNRISARAAQGHIRYVFGFEGGRAFDLPQTPEQTALRDGDGVVVDICSNCGQGLSTDAEFLAAGRRPTMWLQSGSQKLQELAAFGPGETLSDRRKMEILGSRARSVLNVRDFSGHYSALEAAERRAGDCTEDAVLLAALARAAGIPAYVATGLVYSRERYHGVSNAFMPHNWTIAYVDGEWASFDISLDGFDVTHIALSINEGDSGALASAQQLASHLEWRRLTEVRQEPLQP